MLLRNVRENLDQTRRALASGADRLLLDNFSLADMREAVRLRGEIDSGKKLEASGGITLENIGPIAETGVDYISVGAMTKNVRAVDFSMRIV